MPHPWYKLDNWLRKNLFESPAGQAMTRLELCHTVAGGGDTVVQTWALRDIDPSYDIDALGQEIYNTAQDDSGGYETVSKYVVMGYHGDHDFSGSRCAAYHFHPPMSRQVSLEPSEPATGKGFATQQMRHNELLMRQLVALSGVQIEHSAKQLDRAFTRIRELEAERSEYLEAIETVRQSTHERDIEARRVEASEAKREDAYREIKALLPAIVNRISGQKILPENSESPEQASLRLFIESLNPEQLEVFKATLSPPQLIALGEMLRGNNAQH